MRALATLALAVVVSWALAGVVQVALGIELNAHEELIIAMMAEVVLALLVALVFGVVLAARGGRRALAIAAVAIVVLGVAALAGLETFSLSDEAHALDPSDFPLLIELGLPGLVTVLIQWWLVRAHVKRQTARATLVPAEG
jgi:MFS family permease